MRFNQILLALLILTIITFSVSIFFDAFADEAGEVYVERMDLIGDYNAYQRRWMHEAWDLSHDKEFIYMLKAENGLLNHDRQGYSSKIGIDWGFCQINSYYHPNIINDPRFLSDPLWQLEKCYELYLGGTRFYALDRLKNDPNFRKQIEGNFIFF